MNIDKPITKTYFTQEPEEEGAKPPTKDDVETQVIQLVPKSHRNTASKFINYIKSNPNVKFSEKGELVVRDKVVPNTHAVDLINDLLRKSQRV